MENLLSEHTVEKLSEMSELNVKMQEALDLQHDAAIMVTHCIDKNGDPLTDVMVGESIENMEKMLASLFSDLKEQLGDDFILRMVRAQVLAHKITKQQLANMQIQGND